MSGCQGTASDAHTITVDLVDEDGMHLAAGNKTLTVANVAPNLIDSMAPQRARRGQPFYNNSYFDGNNAGANANDFKAIAPHTSRTGGHGPHPTGRDEPTKELGKDALLPGQTATFANYTSYSKGINGVMVDIAGLFGTPTAADFVFKAGNNNDPATWATAPTPTSITVFADAGTLDGQGQPSDRVTIIWPDGAIQKTWLQITVLATPATGLAATDVFYFGNAIGETGLGNISTLAFVTVTDELAARNHPHNILNRATASEPTSCPSKTSRITSSGPQVSRCR